MSELPRGRHHLSAEEVQANQKRRLMRAMAACVAAEGYGPVTVESVTRAAGVSRKSFYEIFDNKFDCFTQTYDFGMSVVMSAIKHAQKQSGSLEERLERGFTALADMASAHPNYLVLIMIEAWGAGPEARHHHSETLREFSVFLEDAQEKLGPTIFNGIIGGITSVIYAEVVNGRVDHLRDVVPDLVKLVVLPIRGLDVS